MHEKLDQAREQILDRIIQWSSISLDSNAPGHVRNLAAVFDILTEKKLAEVRLAGPLTHGDGSTYYLDARGHLLALDTASGTLTRATVE